MRCGLHLTDKYVRNKNNRLQFYFIFIFIFYFILNYFTFSIFRTLRLGLEVIGNTVTSVTFDSMVTTWIMGCERRK